MEKNPDKRGKPEIASVADPHRVEGDGKVAPQSSHAEQVLFVMEREDHAAGAEKQQCLEKSVRDQVEDRRRQRRRLPTARNMYPSWLTVE